jgi:hypothetical protein
VFAAVLGPENLKCGFGLLNAGFMPRFGQRLLKITVFISYTACYITLLSLYISCVRVKTVDPFDKDGHFSP